MKCEMCKKRIVGKIAYVKTKMVCQRCFRNKKYSTRLPRGSKDPYYQWIGVIK